MADSTNNLTITWPETLKCFPWSYQFTIPLLFDDCLSVLQKINALWYKINDIITSLDNFDDQLQEWAEGVETELATLTTQLTTIETRLSTAETNISEITKELTTINNTLTTINNNISNVQTDITDLNTAIEKMQSQLDTMQEMLDSLNIYPPVQIMSDSAMLAAGDNWMNWIQSLSGSSTFTTDWTFTNGKLTTESSDQLGAGITVAYVGDAAVIFKVPFIAYTAYDGTVSTEAQAASACRTTANNYGLSNILQAFSSNSSKSNYGFFTVNLSTPYPYTIDEIKTTGTYIPFFNTNTADAYLFKLDWIINTSGASSFEIIKVNTIRTDVRLQLTKDSQTAQLCVITEGLYMGYYNGNVYLFMICETG